MATEKEFNGNLFDQLELIDRIEEVAKQCDAKEVLDALAKERKYIERKLYQDPPLAKDE